MWVPKIRSHLVHEGDVGYELILISIIRKNSWVDSGYPGSRLTVGGIFIVKFSDQCCMVREAEGPVSFDLLQAYG